jgi:hypothetical protein
MSILGNNDPEYIAAHKHCSNHRKELESSALCGCFHCFAEFPPAAIQQWSDDEQTALCPKCEIDSVIGDASGYPVDRQFLTWMHYHWFALK